MRIAFAGTPEFAAAALTALFNAGHEVPLVLTQPDRPAGRGLKLQPSAVKAVALAHGVPVAQPRSLRLDGKFPEEARAAQAALQAADPDLLVVAAYGLILPSWTLTLPRLGCLNIHASLLPRWRGAAPIHRAIEAGDAQTGITIMQMDEGLDTGDMRLVREVAIAADDTTATLHDRLADEGARAVVEAVAQLAAGTLPREPQPPSGVTYAAKVDKAEAALDWRAPAEVLARRVRAFDPFPGAHFTWAGETIKVWQARVWAAVEAPLAPPGTVVASGPDGVDVACGDGRMLRLLQLQRPGGRRVSARELLAIRPVPAGTRLDA